ncbi:hypothetical protein [Vannielia sp.]|uniref:hypothetical protein n=1 Tax=Vannielia sp. TaxID=2813045 RepID=UPI002614A9F8|nr:hypothetical protein [Vannielia sp.]MDF1873345.1 hypothetical protein [Vannielia sp.]
MGKIRIILIAVTLVVMGGLAFMQYAAISTVSGALSAFTGATKGEYAERDYEAPKDYSNSGQVLIKSTKTGSRVGGDKTITIRREPPNLWTRIRMWFGYQPKDAHAADFARLKHQREREAARNKGVNTVTGRKESTATATARTGSGNKRATTNKSLASRLSGN